MEDLKELEELLIATWDKAHNAQSEALGIERKIRQIKANKWLSDNGFSLGDDFTLKGNRKGKLTQVSCWLGKPTPIFTLYRKDGSLGYKTEKFCTEPTEYTKIS